MTYARDRPERPQGPRHVPSRAAGCTKTLRPGYAHSGRAHGYTDACAKEALRHEALTQPQMPNIPSCQPPPPSQPTNPRMPPKSQPRRLFSSISIWHITDAAWNKLQQVLLRNGVTAQTPTQINGPCPDPPSPTMPPSPPLHPGTTATAMGHSITNFITLMHVGQRAGKLGSGPTRHHCADANLLLTNSMQHVGMWPLRWAAHRPGLPAAAARTGAARASILTSNMRGCAQCDGRHLDRDCPLPPIPEPPRATQRPLMLLSMMLANFQATQWPIVTLSTPRQCPGPPSIHMRTQLGMSSAIRTPATASDTIMPRPIGSPRRSRPALCYVSAHKTSKPNCTSNRAEMRPSTMRHRPTSQHKQAPYSTRQLVYARLYWHVNLFFSRPTSAAPSPSWIHAAQRTAGTSG